MHTPLYGGWGSSKTWNQKMARDSIETHGMTLSMTQIQRVKST